MIKVKMTLAVAAAAIAHFAVAQDAM